MAKFETNVQIMFDTVEPHGLPPKTRRGLTVGTFSQEGREYPKKTSSVQLIDPSERQAYFDALGTVPPSDTTYFGTWINAEGDELYYWLNRQNASVEAEAGHSLFDEAMMLRRMGQATLMLTIESRYNTEQ